MKPSIRTLGEILYSPSQYVIPVFQRFYRWELPQWQKLWENLKKIQEPQKQGNHFMGFLVFVPGGLAQPGQHTAFHLIDGQQRLLSLSLLLTALRNIARRHEYLELAEEIHNDYLVHSRKKNEEHYRVLPKGQDRESYLSLVNKEGTPVGRIAEALSFFEECIVPLASDGEEPLRDLFNVIRQRLEFMCATLETENAYNIFKSLNSTGIPLSASDLIRNFVFMHIPPKDHDEFDQEWWATLEHRFVTDEGTIDEYSFSRFFRDYLMISGQYVRPKDIFESFEGRYEATGFFAKQLARTLNLYAEYYQVISGQNPDLNSQVTAALVDLNSLNSSTTYPLLLFLFDCRKRGLLDDEKLAGSIRMLSGFMLRRFVCGESSRGYGQMFVRAIPAEDNEPTEALRKYLIGRGWPDDRRFKAAFVEFPLYIRGYSQYVLKTLEWARSHKEQADLSKAEIEHIMPQTLNSEWKKSLGKDAKRIHLDWLHRPGNLTLSAYNKELWNHGFKEKRRRYKGSNIVLTREISSYRKWTEKEMKTRGIQLAEEAAHIWTGPDGD